MGQNFPPLAELVDDICQAAKGPSSRLYLAAVPFKETGSRSGLDISLRLEKKWVWVSEFFCGRRGVIDAQRKVLVSVLQWLPCYVLFIFTEQEALMTGWNWQLQYMC